MNPSHPSRPQVPRASAGRRATGPRLAWALALWAGACAPQSAAPVASTALEHSTQAAAAPSTQINFEVPPPPFSDGVFPCSDCHDPSLPVKTKRRTLKTAHQEIELRHDEEHRWCLDCHDTADRDKLHLAGGETLPFDESYRLCGQCHCDKYRDWRAGVHGRRSGDWNGHKTYLLCVHCHSSHAPAFQPMKPLPPPVAPARLGGGGAR